MSEAKSSSLGNTEVSSAPTWQRELYCANPVQHSEGLVNSARDRRLPSLSYVSYTLCCSFFPLMTLVDATVRYVPHEKGGGTVFFSPGQGP